MPERTQRPGERSTGDRIYLLTGATGNLGSSLCRQLVAGGERIRALVLRGDPAVQRVPEEAHVCLGDVLNVSSLDEFFSVPEHLDVYVIHCASIVTLDPDYSQKVFDVNVTGTRNVLEQCVRHKVRRLVYISSTSVIPELPDGEPIVEVSRFEPSRVVGYYAQTKAEATQLVMDAVNRHDLDASVVFPTGIFGPYDYGFGLITSTIIQMVEGRIPVGVAGTFNCADVRDLASGVISCCANGRKGEGYIMGNEIVTMQDLFDAISAASGCKRVTGSLPTGVARVAAALLGVIGKVTGWSTVLTGFTIYNLARNNRFCSDKAIRELGYRFRPFAETIRDEVIWLREEGRIPAVGE